jgi:hypothetical protein
LNTGDILEQLKEECDRLKQAIRALEGLGGASGKTKGRKGRRHMSAEARARIGAAMKKRWAERKRKQKAA